MPSPHHFIDLGQKIINLAHVIEAEWVTFPNAPGSTRMLYLTYAAPTPKEVEGPPSYGSKALGPSVWGVACRQTAIAETNPAAAAVWNYLKGLCEGGTLGALPATTFRNAEPRAGEGG